jgi:hypothetical protein
MKFLVVDDHELIREAMRGALAELGGDAAVLEASDSRETMRLIEEHPDRRPRRYQTAAAFFERLSGGHADRAGRGWQDHTGT